MALLSSNTRKSTIDHQEQLKNMIKERMECWKGKPVTRLLVYRDGVSEGQYKDVLKYELIQIREACETSKKFQKAKIATVIVTKRSVTTSSMYSQTPGDALQASHKVLPDEASRR